MNKKRTQRLISFLLCFVFFWQSVCPAGVDLQTSISSLSSETVRPPFEIEIPAELGSIEKEKTFPNSRKFMIHIQDAHGSYEAQKNIQGLVEHLCRVYGIRELYLEAGSGELHPEMFHFFKEKKLNLKTAELLMKNGEFTGSEMYLLKRYEDLRSGGEKQAQEVKGYGIESMEKYGQNLRLFVEVMKRSEQTDIVLAKRQKELEERGNRIYPAALKHLVREWRRWKKEEDSLLRYAGFLEKEAAKELALDLKDAENQLDYPAMVRLSRLRRMEGKLDAEKVKKEKVLFLRELKGKVSVSLLKEAEHLGDPEKGRKTRYLMEALYADAAKRGGTFPVYPEFKKLITQRMMEEELEGEELYKELETLTEKLFERMAKRTEAKELIEAEKQEILLGKLLGLELSREEWRELKERRTGWVNVQKDGYGIAGILENAEKFYEGAEAREEAFIENIKERKEEVQKGIVVTGGFHAEGLEEKFEAEGISYVSIKPRLLEAGKSREIYLKAMVGKTELGTGSLENSEIGKVLATMPLELQASMGVENQERTAVVRQAVKRVAETGAGTLLNESPYVLSEGEILSSDIDRSGSSLGQEIIDKLNALSKKTDNDYILSDIDSIGALTVDILKVHPKHAEELQVLGWTLADIPVVLGMQSGEEKIRTLAKMVDRWAKEDARYQELAEAFHETLIQLHNFYNWLEHHSGDRSLYQKVLWAIQAAAVIAVQDADRQQKVIIEMATAFMHLNDLQSAEAVLLPLIQQEEGYVPRSARNTLGYIKLKMAQNEEDEMGANLPEDLEAARKNFKNAKRYLQEAKEIFLEVVRPYEKGKGTNSGIARAFSGLSAADRVMSQLYTAILEQAGFPDKDDAEVQALKYAASALSYGDNALSVKTESKLSLKHSRNLYRNALKNLMGVMQVFSAENLTTEQCFNLSDSLESTQIRLFNGRELPANLFDYLKQVHIQWLSHAERMLKPIIEVSNPPRSSRIVFAFIRRYQARKLLEKLHHSLYVANPPRFDQALVLMQQIATLLNEARTHLLNVIEPYHRNRGSLGQVLRAYPGLADLEIVSAKMYLEAERKKSLARLKDYGMAALFHAASGIREAAEGLRLQNGMTDRVAELDIVYQDALEELILSLEGMTHRELTSSMMPELNRILEMIQEGLNRDFHISKQANILAAQAEKYWTDVKSQTNLYAVIQKLMPEQIKEVSIDDYPSLEAFLSALREKVRTDLVQMGHTIPADKQFDSLFFSAWQSFQLDLVDVSIFKWYQLLNANEREPHSLFSYLKEDPQISMTGDKWEEEISEEKITTRFRKKFYRNFGLKLNEKRKTLPPATGRSRIPVSMGRYNMSDMEKFVNQDEKMMERIDRLFGLVRIWLEEDYPAQLLELNHRITKLAETVERTVKNGREIIERRKEGNLRGTEAGTILGEIKLEREGRLGGNGYLALAVELSGELEEFVKEDISPVIVGGRNGVRAKKEKIQSFRNEFGFPWLDSIVQRLDRIEQSMNVLLFERNDEYLSTELFKQFMSEASEIYDEASFVTENADRLREINQALRRTRERLDLLSDLAFVSSKAKEEAQEKWTGIRERFESAVFNVDFETEKPLILKEIADFLERMEKLNDLAVRTRMIGTRLQKLSAAFAKNLSVDPVIESDLKEKLDDVGGMLSVLTETVLGYEDFQDYAIKLDYLEDQVAPLFISVDEGLNDIEKKKKELVSAEVRILETIFAGIKKWATEKIYTKYVRVPPAQFNQYVERADRLMAHLQAHLTGQAPLEAKALEKLAAQLGIVFDDIQEEVVNTVYEPDKSYKVKVQGMIRSIVPRLAANPMSPFAIEPPRNTVETVMRLGYPLDFIVAFLDQKSNDLDLSRKDPNKFSTLFYKEARKKGGKDNPFLENPFEHWADLKDEDRLPIVDIMRVFEKAFNFYVQLLVNSHGLPVLDAHTVILNAHTAVLRENEENRKSWKNVSNYAHGTGVFGAPHVEYLDDQKEIDANGKKMLGKMLAEAGEEDPKTWSTDGIKALENFLSLKQPLLKPDPFSGASLGEDQTVHPRFMTVLKKKIVQEKSLYLLPVSRGAVGAFERTRAREVLKAVVKAGGDWNQAGVLLGLRKRLSLYQILEKAHYSLPKQNSKAAERLSKARHILVSDFKLTLDGPENIEVLALSDVEKESTALTEEHWKIYPLPALRAKEILMALVKANGHWSEAGRLIEVRGRSTLYRRLAKAGYSFSPEARGAANRVSQAKAILERDFGLKIEDPENLWIKPLEESEKINILTAFLAFKGNMVKTAQQIKMTTKSLGPRLKQYGVDYGNRPEALKQVKNLLGDSEKLLLESIIVKKNHLMESIVGMTDDELKRTTAALKESMAREKVTGGELAYGIALFSEAARRILKESKENRSTIDPKVISCIGGYPNNKQIEAALLLIENKNIVGMLPSEGKTFAVGLAAFLKALQGKKVEVHNWSNLLSGRDAQVVGTVLERLGMKVGVLYAGKPYVVSSSAQKTKGFPHLKKIQDDFEPNTQKGMLKSMARLFHESDIVYGPYDRMIFSWMDDWFGLGEKTLHRSPLPEWVLVEEADTPLLDAINEPLAFFRNTFRLNQERLQLFQKIYRFSLSLKKGEDFVLSKRNITVFLTDERYQKLIDDLKQLRWFKTLTANSDIRDWVKAALEAQYLYEKDVHYFAKNNSVLIRDDNTGEVKADRRWGRGIHTFLEIKERLPIQGESEIAAAMTTLEFYNRLPSWSGVMGLTDELTNSEPARLYGVKLHPLEPAHPSLRKELPAKYFLTQDEKHLEIVKMIRNVYPTGRPILINANSPKEAARLAQLLSESHQGSPFLKDAQAVRVIDGRDEEREAYFWNLMGDGFTITIAAQVASRGQEIKLEEHLYQPVKAEGFEEEVAGLFVISTHHGASERVEGQVKTRTARRGRPGMVQIMDHLEDNSFLSHYVPEELSEFLRSSRTFQGDSPAIPMLFELARIRRFNERVGFEEVLAPLYGNLVETHLKLIAFERELHSHGSDIVDLHEVTIKFVNLAYHFIERQDLSNFHRLIRETEEFLEDVKMGPENFSSTLSVFKERLKHFRSSEDPQEFSLQIPGKGEPVSIVIHAVASESEKTQDKKNSAALAMTRAFQETRNKLGGKNPVRIHVEFVEQEQIPERLTHSPPDLFVFYPKQDRPEDLLSQIKAHPSQPEEIQATLEDLPEEMISRILVKKRVSETVSTERRSSPGRVSEAKRALGPLVIKLFNHDWEAQADELPDLKGVHLGTIHAGGLIFFSPQPHYLFRWPVGLPEAGWEVTVVESGVKNNRYELTVELTKEGKNPVRKIFQIGRYTKELKGDGPESGKILEVLDIEERLGLRALSEIITQRKDSNWLEKAGKLGSLKGLQLGVTNNMGQINFSPAEHFPFSWSVLGFHEEGWHAAIADSKITDHYLEFTVELTQEGKEKVSRVFQIGSFTRALKGHQQEKGNVREILEIDTELGTKLFSDLITKDKFFDWEKHKSEIPDLSGMQVGTTNRNGKIVFSPSPHFRFQWNALGAGREGWSGRIKKSGVENGHFQFTVEFTKEGHQTFIRTFQLSPFTRLLKGEERKRGKTLEVWDIDNRPALKGLSELIQKPEFFDWDLNENRVPSLSGFRMGVTGKMGTISFSPSSKFHFSWRPLGFHEAGWEGWVIDSGVKNGLYEFTVEFRPVATSDPNRPLIKKVFQIGRLTRTLRRGDGREMKVLDISEKPGLKALSFLVTRPSDFDWEKEKASLPDLRGFRLGTTNSKGKIIFHPLRKYRYKWPALGFASEGWEAVILKSGVNGGLFEFTVQFNKAGHSSLENTFVIGSFPLTLRGHHTEGGKTKPALNILNAEKVYELLGAEESESRESVLEWLKEILDEMNDSETEITARLVAGELKNEIHTLPKKFPMSEIRAVEAKLYTYQAASLGEVAPEQESKEKRLRKALRQLMAEIRTRKETFRSRQGLRAWIHKRILEQTGIDLENKEKSLLESYYVKAYYKGIFEFSENRELVRQTEPYLKKLSPLQLKVIRLRYMEGLAWYQIEKRLPPKEGDKRRFPGEIRMLQTNGLMRLQRMREPDRRFVSAQRRFWGTLSSEDQEFLGFYVPRNRMGLSLEAMGEKLGLSMEQLQTRIDGIKSKVREKFIDDYYPKEQVQFVRDHREYVRYLTPKRRKLILAIYFSKTGEMPVFSELRGRRSFKKWKTTYTNIVLLHSFAVKKLRTLAQEGGPHRMIESHRGTLLADLDELYPGWQETEKLNEARLILAMFPEEGGSLSQVKLSRKYELSKERVRQIREIALARLALKWDYPLQENVYILNSDEKRKVEEKILEDFLRDGKMSLLRGMFPGIRDMRSGIWLALFLREYLKEVKIHPERIPLDPSLRESYLEALEDLFYALRDNVLLGTPYAGLNRLSSWTVKDVIIKHYEKTASILSLDEFKVLKRIQLNDLQARNLLIRDLAGIVEKFQEQDPAFVEALKQTYSGLLQRGGEKNARQKNDLFKSAESFKTVMARWNWTDKRIHQAVGLFNGALRQIREIPGQEKNLSPLTEAQTQKALRILDGEELDQVLSSENRLSSLALAIYLDLLKENNEKKYSWDSVVSEDEKPTVEMVLDRLGFDLRRTAATSGSSLGLSRSVPENVLNYLRESGREKAPALLWTAVHYADGIFYLPGADRQVAEWFLAGWKQSEGREQNSSPSFLAFNHSLEPFLKYLETRLGRSLQTRENALPLFMEDAVLKKRSTGEDTASRLARSFHEGDLLTMIWQDEKPVLLSDLYKLSKGTFKVRDLRRELVSISQIKRLTKNYETAPLWLNDTHEVSVFAGMEGDRVSLDTELLFRNGIDLGQVVALLRQLADAPELREKLFTLAGLDRSADHWEVGQNFLSLLTEIYAQYQAENKIAVAA